VRKLARQMLDDRPFDKTQRRRNVLAFVLGLSIAPVLYESTALCTARWRSMFGPMTTVNAPLLDTFGVGLNILNRTFQKTASGSFSSLPWKPSLIIPLAFALAIVGSLLMRRR